MRRSVLFWRLQFKSTSRSYEENTKNATRYAATRRRTLLVFATRFPYASLRIFSSNGFIS